MIPVHVEAGKNISSAMGKGSLSILFFLVFFTLGNAQIRSESETIVHLMDTLQMTYKFQNKVKGWRIQIVNTNDRRELEQTRQQFHQQFPGLKTIWTYQAPFYILKVGAFHTKLDSYPLYKRIKEEYTSSFLILDDMTLSEIFEFERSQE